MDSGQPIVIIIELEFNKYEMYRKLGATLGQRGVTDVILLNDCVFRTIDSKDFKYVKENYNTEAPSCYPESMRTEALVFVHINFKEKDKACMIPYKRIGKRIEFLEEVSGFDGFDGEIRHSVAKGFALTSANIYPNLNGELNEHKLL
jgi:hypothetical protein